MPYDPYTSRSVELRMIAPRKQIALAIFLFLCGCAGLYLAATVDTEREMLSSIVVLMSTLLSLWSSLKSGRDGQLDEREREVRSYAIAGGASSVVIAVAIYSIFASSLDSFWLPTRDFQFGALGMFMLSSTIQIAIVLAALKTPTYAVDPDDEI